MIFNDFLFEEINLVCMLILLKSHPIYNILSSENMDNWIKQGLNAKLISLSDDGSTITYIKQGSLEISITQKKKFKLKPLFVWF
jgi:hypothetical protein